jgi:PBSX family phage terminase large subunit
VTDEPIIIEPHSEKQEIAFLSENKITVLCTGIQFGKTRCGSMWMKRQIHTYTDPLDTFLIVAPTYKVLEQSTLPAFLQLMDGFGKYNKQDSTFKVHGGGIVYMRTAKEPDSIVGITNCRAIWGDEAGKYSLYFWENLQARGSFKDAPIMLTTSPYSMNWLFKDLIKPSKMGKRNDVMYITARSDENPYFPKHEFERRRKTMDPRRFAAIYGGEFDKMHGQVYDCFDYDSHIVEPFQLPTKTKYYAGIDWGYSDPFVLIVHAITPEGRRYQVSEFYKSGMTISDIAELCIQKRKVYDIKCFFADPSQPGYIEELNRRGVPTVGANNDIRRGIDLVYEQFKSEKFLIFKDSSPYTIDEIEQYHYEEPKDLGPNDSSKETLPVGQFDHAMDTIRYLVVSTVGAFGRHTAKVPGEIGQYKETIEQKLQRLKRSGGTKRNTENWS